MARLAMVFLACLLALPGSARAFQLHWSDGSTNIRFSQNIRAILIVQSDSTEGSLPSRWRLLWTADSLGIRFVAPESLAACQTDTAKVSSIDSPSSPADSAANQFTAHFCSVPGASTTAYFTLDLAGGSRGKLKAAALSPTDSTIIIESNEVTYNEGVVGEYPSVILCATSTHHLGDLRVTVEGVGLDAAAGLNIEATDRSWTFPLTVVSRSDTRVAAEATLAAPLPECAVNATRGGATIATASLAADNFPPLEPQGGASYFLASQDTSCLLPKDFAFVDAGDSWHIFYTRQYTTGYGDNENTRLIGHAVSTDRNLSTWTVMRDTCNTCAVRARDGRIWDNLHVWAPSMIRKPGDITYYMLYAGVQLDTISTQPNLTTSQVQRVGIATSTDLVHWAQDLSPTYWNKKVSWTFQDSTHEAAWQFRDPFVMPDTDDPGRYLLYFATIDSCARIAGSSGCSIQYLVGVARTLAGDPGNLRTWENVGPLLRTSQSHMAAGRVESPTVLYREGNWWLMYTAARQDTVDSLAFTINGYPATMQAHAASLDTSTWTAPGALKYVTCGEHGTESALDFWHAPEALNLAVNEYLMSWSDDLVCGGRIYFSQIKPPDSTCPTDSFRLVAPDMVAGVPPKPSFTVTKPVSLTLAGPSPAHSATRLQLALARPMAVHVAIYDVFGRHVRTLVNGPVPAGSRTLLWDGHADHGAPVSSGIYFVRATCAAGRQVVRIPLIR